MKCCFEYCLLNFLFEFCLDILHEDQISESFFLFGKCLFYISHRGMDCDYPHKYVESSHENYPSDKWPCKKNPIRMKLIESEISVNILKLIGGIHNEKLEDYSTSSPNMIYRSRAVPTGQQVISEISFLFGSRLPRTLVSPGSTVARSVIR